MTSVLAVIGGSSTVALAVLLVIVLRWAMHARDAETGAVQSEAAEHIEHGETKLKLERAEYDLTKAKEALAIMTKRAEALDKELADEKATLGAGLAADDVDGRLRRIAAETANAGSALPAVAADPVSQPAATGETIAAAVRNLHPIDELR